MEALQSPYERPRPHSPQHREVPCGYPLYVGHGAHEPPSSYSMSGTQYAAGIYEHQAAGDHIRHQGIPADVYHCDHHRDQYGSAANQANIRRRPSLLSEFHSTDRERGPEYYHQPQFDPVSGAVSSQADSDAMAPKRPRLAPMQELKSEVDAKPLRDTMHVGAEQQVAQPVAQEEIKKEPFIPKVENVSPTPCNDQESPSKLSKEGLLQCMEKVDREIAKVESQITKLKKKQQELEERAAKPAEPEKPPSPETTGEPKEKNTVQLIYSENRRKAEQAHNMLSSLGPKYDLPVYNQPSDMPQYQENIKTNVEMRKRLILFFKKRNEARKKRERFLCQKYDQLMEAWEKRMERLENNPKRKAKNAKVREFFEKQFSEIRKQREQQERFSRAGTRSSWGNIARSDAELAEIVDCLNEQEANERHIRSLAVVPPMLFDSEQRKVKFINTNGLIEDPMKEHKEGQRMNVWTQEEKLIFREKYLQHPKNFQIIASFLENKNVADCVLYYYTTKKNENYKQVLRKNQVKRRRGFPAKTTATINRNQDDDDKDGGKEEDSNNQSASGNKDTKPPAEDKGKEEDSGNNGNTGGNPTDSPTTCSVCKNSLDNYALTRPINKTNCDMLGVSENEVTPNMRMCSTCHCKSIRRRYDHRCPVPQCKTPRRLVKRLKPLPAKWSEIPEDQCVTISEELGITEEITKCCAACFNRIARKLGTEGETEEEMVSTSAQENECQATAETSRWTEEEMDIAKNGLRQHGKDFVSIAKLVGTKSEAQCKNFYFNYKRKFNLEQLLEEYRKEKQAKREHKVSTTESTVSTLTAVSDEDESMMSSDDDGNDDSTDTASSDNDDDPSRKSTKPKSEGKETPVKTTASTAASTSTVTSTVVSSTTSSSAAVMSTSTAVVTTAVATVSTASTAPPVTAQSGQVEVKKEIKKEVDQKPDISSLPVPAPPGLPSTHAGVSGGDTKIRLKVEGAIGTSIVPIKTEPPIPPAPVTAAEAAAKAAAAAAAAAVAAAANNVVKKDEEEGLTLPDDSTDKKRDDDDSSATDSADEDHHHQDLVLNEPFPSQSQRNTPSGDKVSSSDEKEFYPGSDPNARSKDLPTGGLSSSQNAATKAESKDPAEKRDNSPESSGGTGRGMRCADYLSRGGRSGVNNIRDLIDSAIDKHLGKPHESSSSSQRDSNTPGGSEQSKRSSSKDSAEDGKHPDSHYGEHARNKTPPRADSSNSTTKPGSRDVPTNYPGHIVHTSHIQQLQQQHGQDEDIYEIRRTPPERYPPYAPSRQSAAYPGQRHPSDHPHRVHREGDPYSSDRERPRVLSPPGGTGSSRGFQGRAGSPSPFALVPAGPGSQIQRRDQLPQRTSKPSNVGPPPPLKPSPNPMKVKEPAPLGTQPHHAGSITQGTPVYTAATTSPTSRYEGHPNRPASYEGLIKTPPMSSPGGAAGSITAGTPVRRAPTPVCRGGTPSSVHHEGSIRGTPINHDSQRGTPITYESTVSRASSNEGASIIHGTSMSHDQMVRPPSHFDVRAVYDPHLRAAAAAYERHSGLPVDNMTAALLMGRHMAQYGDFSNPMIRGQCDTSAFSTSKETIAAAAAAYERHSGLPVDNMTAALLMGRHMAQYGDFSNPMIRGQCDTSAFSTSKETIAGDFQTAKQMGSVSGREATIRSDFVTAKQMGQRLPYPQVSTPNLTELHMSPRHETPLNKRYSPSTPHKPGNIMEALPHMQVLPHGAQIPPQGGIMYLPPHGHVFIPGHGTAAAAAAAAAGGHSFQAPHLIHTPYTTAPVSRGSPHPPLSPHVSRAHPSSHTATERPHQQPSPFQREATSPAEYAAAAAAQQAVAVQAQQAVAAGLARWPGMPSHLRFKPPPHGSSPLGGLPIGINPSSSAAGSIMRGTPMRPPPSITTGVPKPELRGESRRPPADSNSGENTSKSPAGNPSGSGSEAFATLVDVATKTSAIAVSKDQPGRHPGMEGAHEPTHPRDYSKPPTHGSSQEQRISTSDDKRQPKDGRPPDSGPSGSDSRLPQRAPPQHGDGKARPAPQDKMRQDPADASAIFAALFEKDAQKQKPPSGSEPETSQRPTLTAASLIDVIITRSINQPLLEAEQPSCSDQDVEIIPKDSKEPIGVASSSTEGGTPKKPNVPPMPARSEADAYNPGSGSKPTQSSGGGTPSKSVRPITLAEHIDSIILLDYNHSVRSSTSKGGSGEHQGVTGVDGSAVDTTVRPMPEQGASSSMSAMMLLQQKKSSQESEVGSTNDPISRRGNSPTPGANVHSSKAAPGEQHNRSRAGTPRSSNSPDTGNLDDKGNSGTSSTNKRQADTAGQSRSAADPVKPDSHSSGAGLNQWGPQFDCIMVSASGSNPTRNPRTEAGCEASPITHRDLPPWPRKYPHDTNKADSSESPLAGSIPRVHVHSSQSSSPQEGWSLNSTRPGSLGRRSDSPETSTGPGSSSNMHPDASSRGLSIEGKKSYGKSAAVSSGIPDNKWRHAGMMPDRSRSGMPEVESSRSSPVPQSSAPGQASDSMSAQLRHRIGASSSSRSPVAGQSNALSIGSSMPQRGGNPQKEITLDLRRSIDRMIESQVRVDDLQHRQTQVRVDDYVTQLFDQEMSSSLSTQQRCDSRESTSTAESGPGLQVDEGKMPEVSEVYRNRQEQVSEGLKSSQRPSHSSPRQSSIDTAETESPPPRTPPRGGADTTPSHNKPHEPKARPATSSASRRPEEAGGQASSQSLIPSSSQQGYPGQYQYSALPFPYGASTTAPSMGHHLPNPQRNIPSPRAPPRGPSPNPGPGATSCEAQEAKQILSNKYETLSDSD